MTKRWVVVNLEERPMRFTYWHYSEKQAREEAARLARQVQGSRFAVLETVVEVRVQEVPLEWSEAEPDDKRLPF